MRQQDGMKRALCLVMDSVGCGNAPDAAVYGDEGANTLGHLYQRAGLRLPHLESLGLAGLLGIEGVTPLPQSTCTRLTETSAGKDTTTGHWELMGCRLEKAFDTFESFPADLVEEIERRGNVHFIGNHPASGTEILTRLGETHLQTGHPILYTSADSVLQIAAHETVFGLERLWELCKTARRVLDERGLRIGRVIARPFTGESAATFKRTGNRHDYSLVPPETVLDRLVSKGVPTLGVGKISDIFAGKGIAESHPTASNAAGMETIDRLWAERRSGSHLIFANLVDFDALYGHRRDPGGYANCLKEFDTWLGGFLSKIGPADFVIITADHGNDPYHAGTDHTREQVPAMAIHAPAPFTPGPFSRVAQWLESHFAG